MHDFKADFYGEEMKVLVLGYIRPELDYTSRGRVTVAEFLCRWLTLNEPEALIDDIEIDKQVSLRSLSRPDYAKYAEDMFFKKIEE